MSKTKKNISITAEDKKSSRNFINDDHKVSEKEYFKLADESLQGIIILQGSKIVYANEAFIPVSTDVRRCSVPCTSSHW